MHFRVIQKSCIAIAFLFLVLSPVLTAQEESGDSAIFTEELHDSVLSGFSGSVFGNPIRLDSSRIRARTMDSAEMASYADDSDFDYAQKKQPPRSLMGRLWKWLSDAVGFVLDNQFTGRMLLYIVIIVAIVTALYFILRGERTGLLGPKGAKSKSIQFEEEIQDIHSVDLEGGLQSAVAARDLRSAVRFQFLLLLRDLSESDLIDWRQAKTNEDYRRELPEGDVKSRFVRLVRVFDWAWYGGYPVTPGEYAESESEFNQLRTMVSGRSARS